jgi:hypothetical protein
VLATSESSGISQEVVKNLPIDPFRLWLVKLTFYGPRVLEQQLNS